MLCLQYAGHFFYSDCLGLKWRYKKLTTIMLILLSPAKRLSSNPLTSIHTSQPYFQKEMKTLMKIMKQKSVSDLKELMKISDKLAELNVKRYKEMKIPYNSTTSSAAIYTFQGDAYLGLNAETLDESAINYSQHHLRLLSGFYGLLKPLDLILPYRLEMGIKLKTKRHKNLYEFWGNKITNLINVELDNIESDLLINLASIEYFRAVNTKMLNAKVLTINFKEYRDGNYKFMSVFGKKARGLMTRFIIKNKLVLPEEIKGFDAEGYQFNEELSTQNEWLFSRPS